MHSIGLYGFVTPAILQLVKESRSDRARNRHTEYSFKRRKIGYTAATAVVPALGLFLQAFKTQLLLPAASWLSNPRCWPGDARQQQQHTRIAATCICRRYRLMLIAKRWMFTRQSVWRKRKHLKLFVAGHLTGVHKRPSNGSPNKRFDRTSKVSAWAVSTDRHTADGRVAVVWGSRPALPPGGVRRWRLLDCSTPCGISIMFLDTSGIDRKASRS